MEHPSYIEAVVLAGGKGTRLKPLTDDLPKPLVPIGGRPILDLLLTRLRKSNIRRARLAVNHMADQIECVIGDGKRWGIEVTYHHEPSPLSTVGPLKLIEGLPDDFVVVNGDILTDLDFASLVQNHESSEALVTVATCRRTHNVDFGVIETNSEGRMVAFSEKPTHSFTVSAGAYAFSRRVLDHVPDGTPFGFDDLMLRLLAKGLPIATFPHTGYWRDIGRPNDYLQAVEEFDGIRHLFE